MALPTAFEIRRERIGAHALIVRTTIRTGKLGLLLGLQLDTLHRTAWPLPFFSGALAPTNNT